MAIVGGAALGAAFGLLFDVVQEAIDQSSRYKTLLTNIKSTLDLLNPVIKKIGEQNEILGLPDEEIKYLIDEIQEGVVLVRNSSNVSRWNCIKFHYYMGQLIELDGSLRVLLNVLMVQGVRDVKETLFFTRENHGHLVEIENNGKKTLELARGNQDQITESTENGKETLALAKKMEKLLKRIERLSLVTCTYKGKLRCQSGNRVTKASRRAGRSKTGETSTLKVFRLAELKAATGNFREDGIIGEDYLGKIYKGWVDEKTLAPSKFGTGMTVAVNRMIPERMQGVKEWASEVNFIGRLSHPNLIKLLGYCCEKKEVVFVYQYMPNGSLHNHLFGSPDEEPLSWDTRLKIAKGAAQGLSCIHSLQRQIIHRDFKPKNILLDLDYNAKISYFYLAKWGPADAELHESVQLCGTIGYIDPQYMITGRFSIKSDVYSFGVVLLEILTGLKSYDFSRPEEQILLVDWAIPLLRHEENLQTILDPQIEGQYSFQEALQTANLTLKCLQTNPERRPSMKEVVEELEHIQAMKESTKVTTVQSSSSPQ